MKILPCRNYIADGNKSNRIQLYLSQPEMSFFSEIKMQIVDPNMLYAVLGDSCLYHCNHNILKNVSSIKASNECSKRVFKYIHMMFYKAR